jgi:predicted RNA-binding Zn-ribbon protein involved in translation (DUF1610 family)
MKGNTRKDYHPVDHSRFYMPGPDGRMRLVPTEEYMEAREAARAAGVEWDINEHRVCGSCGHRISPVTGRCESLGAPYRCVCGNSERFDLVYEYFEEVVDGYNYPIGAGSCSTDYYRCTKCDRHIKPEEFQLGGEAWRMK